MVQWLGLSAFAAKGTGSIPGWGIKIMQATQCNKKKKKKKDNNKQNQNLLMILRWLKKNTWSFYFTSVKLGSEKTIMDHNGEARFFLKGT